MAFDSDTIASTRILLNGVIPLFQQPEPVVGLFGTYRNQYPVTPDVLQDVAQQVQNGATNPTNRSTKWNHGTMERWKLPKGEGGQAVEPYFRRAQPDQVVLIRKAREPTRVLTAIGNKKDNRGRLQLAQRRVVQYNFYVHHRNGGRIFVRIQPYFPFSARFCRNQHHWLARHLRQEGIDLRQTTHAFLGCRHPQRMEELADSQTPPDLLLCGRKRLNGFTSVFTEKERRQPAKENQTPVPLCISA